MKKVKNLTILASLFLGVMMFGGNAASAAALNSAVTTPQFGDRNENLVEKVRHRRWHRRRSRRRSRSRRRRNLGLGIAGAIIGGAIINNQYNRRRYREPRRGRYEYGSAAWEDYCYSRFKSFNKERYGYYRSYRYGLVRCR